MNDVVVVGGGIIGLSIAFELVERGRSVLVLDEGRDAGSATPAAAGMLAPAAEADIELPGLTAFRRMSHALYPDFVARLEAQSGIECGLCTRGSMVVAVDRDQQAEMERLRVIMAEQDFPGEPLTPEEALQMEPALSPRVVGALRLPHDHLVDPRRMQAALRATLDVRTEHVDDVDTIAADVVVLATGSWTGAGVTLPIRPVKGQVLRLHAPGFLQRVVRTAGVYLVPHTNGDLVIGASVEEQGYDVQPTAGATLDLLRHAWRAAPGIYDLPLREVSVGLRPAARDHLPVIGRIGDTRMYVATGHYRNGILWAPGTAKMMADLICDGRSDPLLDHFSPSRFVRVIRINGATREIQAPLALAALPELRDAIDRPGTAVAVNGEVVLRRDWNTREVNDGDDIEIVQAVQGG
jgi:glycine oxidase